ncbi:hypothetical protein CR513_41887, partial [Mucuna pruriens]
MTNSLEKRKDRRQEALSGNLFLPGGTLPDLVGQCSDSPKNQRSVASAPRTPILYRALIDWLTTLSDTTS